MLRVVAAIAFTLFAGVASAERRVALVMGDDDYRTVRKLDNAINDARTLEETLKKLGFDVFLEPDRDLRRMRRALDDFREDAKGADVALVFFAGHGVEISGENRLLPVDADASSLNALEASSLPLEEVRATVGAASKIGLIILDACRNDPFGAGDGAGPWRGVVAGWEQGRQAGPRPHRPRREHRCSHSRPRLARRPPMAPTAIRRSRQHWPNISAPTGSKSARC